MEQKCQVQQSLLTECTDLVQPADGSLEGLSKNVAENAGIYKECRDKHASLVVAMEKCNGSH